MSVWLVLAYPYLGKYYMPVLAVYKHFHEPLYGVKLFKLIANILESNPGIVKTKSNSYFLPPNEVKNTFFSAEISQKDFFSKFALTKKGKPGTER